MASRIVFSLVRTVQKIIQVFIILLSQFVILILSSSLLNLIFIFQAFSISILILLAQSVFLAATRFGLKILCSSLREVEVICFLIILIFSIISSLLRATITFDCSWLRTQLPLKLTQAWILVIYCLVQFTQPHFSTFCFISEILVHLSLMHCTFRHPPYNLPSISKFIQLTHFFNFFFPFIVIFIDIPSLQFSFFTAGFLQISKAYNLSLILLILSLQFHTATAFFQTLRYTQNIVTFNNELQVTFCHEQTLILVKESFFFLLFISTLIYLVNDLISSTLIQPPSSHQFQC